MPIEDLVKQVAGTLERDSGVRAVFGPSIELQHHVIVPVAVISGGAAGGGSQPGMESGAFAGGMGIGLNVRPVGFIHESGDHVIFTPIHVEERRRSILAEAANGVRRAVNLLSSVVTQFVQNTGPRVPAPPRAQVDGAQVSSPS